jgi:hypothetical protein
MGTIQPAVEHFLVVILLFFVVIVALIVRVDAGGQETILLAQGVHELDKGLGTSHVISVIKVVGVGLQVKGLALQVAQDGWNAKGGRHSFRLFLSLHTGNQTRDEV